MQNPKQPPVSLVFFGSFLQYSASVLQALLDDGRFQVTAVVTTPPLIDKKKGMLKNPVHQLAEAYATPVCTPDTLTSQELQKLTSEPSNYFLTAGYGKLLPQSWLEHPHIASLNLHLSLLPHYRGANPAEWMLLRGERKAGVTLIEMSPQFDTGKMIAQSIVEIQPTDTRETLYETLYTLGAREIGEMLQKYHHWHMREKETLSHKINIQPGKNKNSDATQYYLPPSPQPKAGVYARRLSRDDGYIQWSVLQKILSNQAVESAEMPPLFAEVLQSLPIQEQPALPKLVMRATRALAGYPGLWTTIPTKKGKKRMKILEVSLKQNNQLVLEVVRIEGQNTAKWSEVKNGVIN